MPTYERTVTTPDSFGGQPVGRTALLDKIYIGFVKDTKDVKRMGRLRVYIPEIGGDPKDESSWYLVSYASPFAGATSPYATTNGDQYQDSQRSYGMWFIPPDVDNEVMCCFINGDPGRGYWFACLYQERMNHMVPGIPGNNSTATEPVGEYNKRRDDINPDNPKRPKYTPLADQLVLQGLEKDDIRGVSSSGARRDEPINSVYGMLTPGGSQFVFDDNPANKFVRLRTQNGSQILINDTTGCIYINSRDGKNWLELNAEGEVDLYAYGDISLRTQGSLNLRADLDVNIEAGRSIYMKARADEDIPDAASGGGMILMSANVDIHQWADRNVHITAGSSMHRTAGEDIFDTADGDASYKAGGSLYVQADDGDTDIKASGEIHMVSTNIHLNSVMADDAEPGADATERSDTLLKDNQIVSEGKYKTGMRNTIVYRMPYHEPYDHSGSTKGTNGRVEETNSRIDPALQLARDGEIVPNQTKPTNIIGSPRPGMPPGRYTGESYDDKGNPVYKYEGGVEGLNPATSYRLSQKGKEFMHKFEGLAQKKYPDPPGQSQKYSIGWGHLLLADELAGNYVRIGDQKIYLDRALTRAECDALYDQDIAKREPAVQKAITAKITQTQFDMLFSFYYNTGKLAGTDLAKAVNAGEFEKVPAGFMNYTKAGGKVLQALVRRRQAEAANFMSGFAQTNPTGPTGPATP